MRRRRIALLATVLVAASVIAFTPLGQAGADLVLPKGSVGTDQLRAKAVTRGKIKERQVTRDKIAANAVGRNELGPKAVGTEELVDGAVTTGKLAQLPAAGVASNARQTVQPAAELALSFELVEFNQGPVHVASAPTRLTAPVTGIYVVSANVAWATAPGDNTARRLAIRKNGAALVAEVVRSDTSPDVRIVSNVSEVVRLAAGEYLEVIVSHGSGGPLDIVPVGGISPEFQLAFLTPTS